MARPGTLLPAVLLGALVVLAGFASSSRAQLTDQSAVLETVAVEARVSGPTFPYAFLLNPFADLVLEVVFVHSDDGHVERISSSHAFRGPAPTAGRALGSVDPASPPDQDLVFCLEASLPAPGSWAYSMSLALASPPSTSIPLQALEGSVTVNELEAGKSGSAGTCASATPSLTSRAGIPGAVLASPNDGVWVNTGALDAMAIDGQAHGIEVDGTAFRVVRQTPTTWSGVTTDGGCMISIAVAASEATTAASIRCLDGSVYALERLWPSDPTSLVHRFSQSAGPALGTSASTGRSAASRLFPLPARRALARATVTADLLVAHTTAARLAAGGVEAITTAIEVAVTEANGILAASGTEVEFNLVHLFEVIDYESNTGYTSDSAAWLEAVINPSDGVLDVIPSTRDAYGADLTVLVTEAGSACATGRVPASPTDTAFSEQAFTLVRRTCLSSASNLGLLYALGLNMGCQPQVDPPASPPVAVGDGIYDYSHAYLVRVFPDEYRTVMGYPSLGYNPVLLPLFSSPDLDGPDQTGPLGSAAAADNAASIDNAAPLYSNFRAPILVPTCGNGVTEAGEECDAGDDVVGGCCSLACTFVAPGTACLSDGNRCTTDTCDGAGFCGNVPNTASCFDGIYCNGLDTCFNGSCTVHAGDPCAASVDPCNAVCSELFDNCHSPSATPCAPDANNCTRDHCLDGACVHTPDNSTDGASCDDDLYCTINEVCAGGTCTGTVSPALCACNVTADCNDGNPCTTNECDTLNGTCVFAPSDLLTCDDGLRCTGAETCDGGTCVSSGDPCAGNPICNATCIETGPLCQTPPGVACEDDGLSCTNDTCLAAVCIHTVLPNGTACSDGTNCTSGDVCLGNNGTCAGTYDLTAACQCLTDAGCDDGNPCTVDSCETVAGTCLNLPVTGTGCDDGVFCNGPDFCNRGACVHLGNPCAGARDCADTCYETNSTCFDPAGTPCGDGRPCTDSYCSGNGFCLRVFEGEGTLCDSSNPCSLDEACDAGGICLGTLGPPPCACLANADCDDDNPCTRDRCNLGICAYSPMPEGLSCDDGLWCNGDDYCSAGTCAHPNPPCPPRTLCNSTCDETARTCEKTGACDDLDPCTRDETCQAGICVPAETSTPCDDACSDRGLCCFDACYCFEGWTGEECEFDAATYVASSGWPAGAIVGLIAAVVVLVAVVVVVVVVLCRQRAEIEDIKAGLLMEMQNMEKPEDAPLRLCVEDYEGRSIKELTFRKGDIVHAGSMISEKWGQGSIGTRDGMYMYKFTRPIGMIRTDLGAEADDEHALTAGQRLIVIQRLADTDDGRLLVQLWESGEVGSLPGYQVTYPSFLAGVADESAHDQAPNRRPSMISQIVTIENSVGDMSDPEAALRNSNLDIAHVRFGRSMSDTGAALSSSLGDMDESLP